MLEGGSFRIPLYALKDRENNQSSLVEHKFIKGISFLSL